jgi:copper chaperone
MFNLAMMARSRLDADQPCSMKGLDLTGLDLTIMARFKLPPSQNRKDLSMNQTFNVKGMTCGHCERAVTQAVKTLDPRAEVRIDRSTGKVEVQSDQPREALIAAITEEGYAAA